MKIDVKNKYTSNVQFSAEIDDSGNYATNIGRAVLWWIENRTRLRDAGLSGADLSDADLRNADLRNADLSDANLSGAKLIVFQLPIWTIYITAGHMRIGCQYHTHGEWANFTNAEISKMDSNALDWWTKHKQLIMAGVEAVKSQG